MKLHKVIDDRQLRPLLLQRERIVIDAPLDTLDEETQLHYSWQWQAMPMLLWAAGYEDFPAYDGTYAGDYQSPHFITKYRSAGFIPPAPPHPRSEAEIDFGENVAMLWHWRFRERMLHGGVPPFGFKQGILNCFGAGMAKYLAAIPLQPELPHDFLLGNTPVHALGPEDFVPYERLTQWRHHALAWVLGPETWEDTTTDT